MITGINESKTLTEHISCQCECKFYGGECNSNQNGTAESVSVSVTIIIRVKEIIFGILRHVVVKMESI